MLTKAKSQAQAEFRQVVKHGPFFLQIKGTPDFLTELTILKSTPKLKGAKNHKSPYWFKTLRLCLDQHRHGTHPDLQSLPFDFSNLTDFQRQTVLALLKIPYGQTWSYAQLAQKVKKPKAARAVGTAISKNPFLILLPCHRVCRSNNELGQFSGGSGTKTKADLIDFEQNCLAKKH